jgi:two-component system sensor histidine kinase KdpD
MTDQQSSEHFLDLIKKSRRGRFKVYIGMIAGVGKTYRMLQEAHELLKAGVDVKIGFIEPHLREETIALSEGLPFIPRKKVFYKGHELEEMDLDEILRNRPEIVLVDELAHTNIPGSKNEKRWQDVMELLNAGINVISAFNVQHLESMVDRVRDLAGIEVKETIPDRVLTHADEVVNIDLPAEDLIKRLEAGKIYPQNRIQAALDNFFQPEKILQLREFALRQVAIQVEKKISKNVPISLRPPTEKFLACISTNYEGGKKILRKTARMASHYQADWLVLYIQTPGERTDRIKLSDQRKLLQNLQWAAQQGGRVIKKESTDIPLTIFDVAQQERITNIVLGRPSFSIYRQLSGKNYFDKLLKKVAETNIDIILVF